MRKFFRAALLAAFFSLLFTGCYTRFEAPSPSYGRADVEYEDYDYYYGGGLYLEYSPYPCFFGYGWRGPMMYAYPYFSYSYFYNPWWYDPWYYYYGDSYTRRAYQKDRRDRRNNNVYHPPSRIPQFSPAPQPAEPVRIKSSTAGSPSGISKQPDTQKQSSGETKTNDKGSRGRR